MKKTLILGDIHGRTVWQNIVKKEQPDQIILLGDYFDSYEEIDPEKEVANFEKILKLKKKYKENCVLCIGNHDYAYGLTAQYSRYQSETQRLLGFQIRDLYDRGILVPFHIEGDIIFSHAGITKTWLKKVLRIKGMEELKTIDKTRIYRQLDYNEIEENSPIGDSVSQSPIWVRPDSLLNDKVPKYTQVVGHTQFFYLINEKKVWFCDTLEREYLTIVDGKFIINKTEKRPIKAKAKKDSKKEQIDATEIFPQGMIDAIKKSQALMKERDYPEYRPDYKPMTKEECLKLEEEHAAYLKKMGKL